MYDRANLAAKHCKGNYIRNYAFYTRQMSQEIEKEQRIVNSMKSALENHEFVVFYQPKYGLSDNQIAGAEALVRWKHPERGMISPESLYRYLNGMDLSQSWIIMCGSRPASSLESGWMKERIRFRYPSIFRGSAFTTKIS